MGKRPFLQAGSVDRAPQDLVAMMVVVLYDGLTRTRARAEVARVRVRASVLLRCTEQRPRPWIEGEVISTTELAQRRTYERLHSSHSVRDRVSLDGECWNSTLPCHV